MMATTNACLNGIRKVLSGFDSILGKNWKSDEELTHTIISRRDYDSLQALIEGAVKIKSLLAETTVDETVLESVTIKSSDISNIGSRLESLEIIANENSDKIDKMVDCIEESRNERNDAPDNLLVEDSVTSSRLQTSRKCNLMMFGNWSEKKSYYKEVYDVLEYLDVNEEALDIDIVKHVANTSNNRTILRVSFHSPKPVRQALGNAKHLRSYGKNEVFLARDLTYHERTELRGLVRLQRKNITERSNFYWAIRHGRVVNLGLWHKEKPNCDTKRKFRSLSSSSSDVNTGLSLDLLQVESQSPADPIEQEEPTATPISSIESEKGASNESDSESSVGDWRLEDEPEHIQKAVKAVLANYRCTSSSSDDEE